MRNLLKEAVEYHQARPQEDIYVKLLTEYFYFFFLNVNQIQLKRINTSYQRKINKMIVQKLIKIKVKNFLPETAHRLASDIWLVTAADSKI